MKSSAGEAPTQRQRPLRLVERAEDPAFVDEEVRRCVRLGVWIALGAVLAQTTLHLANAFIFDSRYWNLNADEERNLFAVLSSVITFAAAVPLALIAVARRFRPRLCASLAGVLAFLALDDGVVIHERVAGRLADLLGIPNGFERVIWPAVYLPLFGAVALALVLVASAAPQPSRRAVFAGLGALAFAIAVEVAYTPFLFMDDAIRSNAHVFTVAFEEGAELGGWIVISFALAGAAVAFLARPNAS